MQAVWPIRQGYADSQQVPDERHPLVFAQKQRCVEWIEPVQRSLRGRLVILAQLQPN
jgi:hypothetical protein